MKRMFALGAALGGLALAAYFLPVGERLLGLVEWLRGAGPPGMVVFAAAYLLATVVMLPGSVLTLGAGFAYGPVVGLLLVSPASVLAATVAFVLGRTVARGWVSRRVGANRRFAAIDEAVAQGGFKMVLLLRLSPVVPFNLLNYALGLTRVGLGRYVLASFIGMLPGTFFYVYLGSFVTSASELLTAGKTERPPWAQALYWGGLLATAVATVLITRLARRALRVHMPPGSEDPGSFRPGAQQRGGLMSPVTDGAASARADERGRSTLVLPDDEANRELVRNVHPADWENPHPAGRYNLVVIGAGTAGLVTAAGAAGLGAKVALVERHLMGGDCLNYGCVPSKAVIRSAAVAHAVREAEAFGVSVAGPIRIDFAAAMARMRRLRAGISHHDSAARFKSLGVDVFIGQARFTGADTVEVGGRTLRFSRAVIATGARASVPAVPGLNEAGYLTSETVFSLTVAPRRLAVIGAGPIGCELAQAFRRLGSEVVVVSLDDWLLPREDPDVSSLLARRFAAEGVDMKLGAGLTAGVERGGRQEVDLSPPQQGGERHRRRDRRRRRPGAERR